LTGVAIRIVDVSQLITQRAIRRHIVIIKLLTLLRVTAHNHDCSHYFTPAT